MSRLRAAGTLGFPVANDVRLFAGDDGVWRCSTRSGVGDGHCSVGLIGVAEWGMIQDMCQLGGLNQALCQVERNVRDLKGRIHH